MDNQLRVTQLIEDMTLEEKVAQLSCVTRIPEAQWLLDVAPTEAAAELILRHPDGVGQLGRPSQQLDAEAAAHLTNAIQHALATETRLGIPALFNEEGVHGHVAIGSTMYPAAIALAATWDTALIANVFASVASEVRARGSNYVYAPVLDVARDPRWGRFEETFGEDPYLVSMMGVAAIQGLQGTGWEIPSDRVLACAKHFAGHGAPEAGINAAPLHAGERELREEHLAPFATAVAETQLGAIMAAYHEIDGIPCHANEWLLTEVLRSEWGFEGMISSDGFGLPQLVREHHVAADIGEAARLSLTAGVDCEVPEGRCFETLPDQVRSGLIAPEVIDRAVARVVTAKHRLGLLDGTPSVDAALAAAVVNNPKHKELALKAALRSATLLKNEDALLPIDLNEINKVALIGPNAADPHLGGYAREGGPGVSALQGLSNRLGPDRVIYAEGCRITDGVPGAAEWWADEVRPADPAAQPELIAAARDLAKAADVAILVIGGNEATAREGWASNHLGDRASLDLPGQQIQLVEAVASAGTPTVAVVTGGRPLDLSPIAERCGAVLQIWYPGQEGGHALAALLCGDENPSGKLPVTIAGSVGRVPSSYRDKPSKHRGYLFEPELPLFPFGHGLSYTTFEYGHPRVDPPIVGIADTTTVSIELTNTGNRAGTEVVQCYVRDKVASVTRPAQSLCGFTPIHLEPGETTNVIFPIGPPALSLLDVGMNRVVEPGSFELRIGGSSASSVTTDLIVR